MEHDDDADAEGEHVPFKFLLYTSQVNNQGAVLDEHEYVCKLVPAVRGQKHIIHGLRGSQVECNRRSVNQETYGRDFDQHDVKTPTPVLLPQDDNDRKE